MTLATIDYCQVLIREERVRVNLRSKATHKLSWSMDSSNSTQTLPLWKTCFRGAQSRGRGGLLKSSELRSNFSIVRFIKGLA